MRIYLMTDLEGVAGVLNFEEWGEPGAPYHLMAREFLTLEVNAAVNGFFAGGAAEIVVVDGHGPGAIDVKLLDPRVQVSRGWADGGWPLSLDTSYDAIAWVGQHAKACTPYGHLCHTQSFACVDESVNGVSIGEFGQLALCASELGVRSIFASGDEALCQEAQALMPGIETVAVKWGLRASTGEDLTHEQYSFHISSARHLHPVQARERIRIGAQRAVERAQGEDFGITRLIPPFTRVTKLRRSATRPYPTVTRASHPTSFIGVMNARGVTKPVAK